MKTLNSLRALSMIVKSTLCPLIIIMCLGNSCKKDSNLIQAKVLDSGSEAVDGCGWLIIINKEMYYPTNLSTDFQKNGQKILIRYKLLNEDKVCGFPYSGVSRPKIELLEIKNK